MKNQILLTLTAVSVLGLVACDKKPTTEITTPNGDSVVVTTPSVSTSAPVAETKNFETSRLGSAIDTYQREPTGVNKAAVEKGFADVDEDIAKLQDRAAKTAGSDHDEAQAKAANLIAYKNAETLRFTQAQAASAVGVNPVADDRSGAQKVQDGAKDVGNSIQDAAKATGRTIEHEAKKVGNSIDNATH